MTSTGEQVTGTIAAENETAAARSLDEQRLFPVELSEATANAAAFSVGGRRKVRSRDVGVMFGQLADLLRAGVPLLRALGTVRKASINAQLKSVVSEVHDEVAAGENFADTLEAHGEAFAPLQAALVRAGERGGFLEDVLTNLAQFIERQADLRSRVLSAMIYPIILMVGGMLGLTAILMVMVPRFKPIFGNAESLPLPTQVLFGLSDALNSHWPFILLALAALVVAAWQMLRSEAGARQWDRWRFRIPIAGNAMRMVAITRFCRIMGTMLANGVPILQALQIAKDAAGSVLLAEAIEKAADNVRGGDPLAEPLGDSGLFPIEVLEMIAVAEESNQLERVLVEVANTVERRTNRQVDVVVALMQPLILVLLAIVILFVAIGLLYPIVTMGENLM